MVLTDEQRLQIAIVNLKKLEWFMDLDNNNDPALIAKTELTQNTLRDLAVVLEDPRGERINRTIVSGIKPYDTDF